MSEITATDRLAFKTPEASFLHVLQNEFNPARASKRGGAYRQDLDHEVAK